MNNTPLSFDTMQTELIQQSKTYIPINNANPHIIACPESIHIQDLDKVFHINCGYIVIVDSE